MWIISKSAIGCHIFTTILKQLSVESPSFDDDVAIFCHMVVPSPGLGSTFKGQRSPTTMASPTFVQTRPGKILFQGFHRWGNEGIDVIIGVIMTMIYANVMNLRAGNAH